MSEARAAVPAVIAVSAVSNCAASEARGSSTWDTPPLCAILSRPGANTGGFFALSFRTSLGSVGQRQECPGRERRGDERARARIPVQQAHRGMPLRIGIDQTLSEMREELA